MRWSLLLGMLIVWPGVPSAMILDLVGQAVQGGVMIGSTDPHNKVVFDGRPIRLDKLGRFIIGFGRDAPSDSHIVINTPEGERQQRTIRVARRDYRVQRIDGLPKRMVSPSAKALARIRKENAVVARARAGDLDLSYFADAFKWPVHGPISGVYGSQRILNGKPRRPHYGVDIARPTGTPVRAPAGGVITLAADDMYFTGGTIILDHGHGLSSAFLHLSKVLVTPDQRVAQGEVIGLIGATGRVTGAHLDWRMNLFKARVDPQLLVPPMLKKDSASQ